MHTVPRRHKAAARIASWPVLAHLPLSCSRSDMRRSLRSEVLAAAGTGLSQRFVQKALSSAWNLKGVSLYAFGWVLHNKMVPPGCIQVVATHRMAAWCVLSLEQFAIRKHLSCISATL